MIVIRSGNESIEGMASGENCHYLHQQGDTVAALDMCDQVQVLHSFHPDISNKRLCLG